MSDASLSDTAPQHGPRPLPLFLDLLRSETAANPMLRAAALAGLSRYQTAPRARPPVPMPVVARAGRAALRDYGGAGPPLVVVPSLINPPTVLDLDTDTSLLRWLSTQGLRPMLVDWGVPDAGDAARDVADHVETLLVPLLETLGREPPLLAGYCLGGAMALAAATLVPIRALALIATPWRFSGFPDVSRAAIAALWANAAPSCAALGLVPMEVLQAGFWGLDPARVIAKYAAFARTEPDSAGARAFVALEDWANGGAPLPFAAGRELFDGLLAGDVTGRGEWCVDGRRVVPDRLDCPVLDFISANDRIVPAASATGLPRRHIVDAGHVGMIIGSRARTALWAPLADFLRGT